MQGAAFFGSRGVFVALTDGNHLLSQSATLMGSLSGTFGYFKCEIEVVHLMNARFRDEFRQVFVKPHWTYYLSKTVLLAGAHWVGAQVSYNVIYKRQ
jgi:hypothetical protein